MAIPALLTVSPSHLVGVTDADEEVFSLYTELAGWSERTTEFDEARSAQAHRHPTRVGSLGFLDSGASVVAIRLEIRPPPPPCSQPSAIGYSRRARKAKHDPASQRMMKGKEIEVELKQDILATTYRSGDTGSIVWRASIDLAELLWYELLFPSVDVPPPELSAEEEEHTSWRGFLDMGRLTGAARILELGAGTGSLGILCAGMFPPESTASWTVSDQFDLLAIVTRNFAHNRIPLSKAPGDHGARHNIEEIDWLEVEKQWLKKNQADPRPTSEPSDCTARRYDLILAVDCLYNEALVDPLLRTLDHLATADPQSPTLVLVVSELRSSDVVQLFLRHWQALRPSWSIFRLPLPLRRPLLNLNIAKPHYAIWCGWKN